MQINSSIFKAYDIRGIYGIDFNEEFVFKLALAFAAMRRKELKRDNITLVAGRDMRVSSPILHKTLIKGFIAAGVHVIDIDLAAAPTFYFSVAHYGYDGGILVSASHNPKEYNGFKLVRERAVPVSSNTGMDKLRDMIINNSVQKYASAGSVVQNRKVLSEHIQRALEYGNIAKIKPLKVVIDPANAMGALYCDELFLYLPCELIRINWNLDGTFPSHEADPFQAENMVQLGQKVREVGADLGISTDGDGDRIFFCDEQGRPIEPWITRAILCKIFLKDNPGSKIVYDIRPGRITRDTIVENGGVPIIARVGHSLIKEKAIAEGAVFAGESSGHFFYNFKEGGCYEIPLIVMLKLLEEFSQNVMKVSQYIKPYQKYVHSGEINTEVDDPDAIISQIKSKYSNGQLNELDGISIEYQDFWFNVRKSNTQPLLRLNVEARTKDLMQKKRDELLKIIRGQ